MKLIIQIPCLNESETLAIALAELPRTVEGFDTVEWLIIDDGSTDNTAEVARASGVHHVVRHPVNRGLAEAFMTGIDACLALGADVIVNTDADNQYNGADIPKLTAPVLAGEAEIVIGARPISETEHFSWIKKKLQRLGSWAVRVASRTNVADAPSGFRAISREAAMRLNVFNAYTYTLETIIQAGRSNMRVLSVPVRTNADLRPSRLVKSISSYVKRWSPSCESSSSIAHWRSLSRSEARQSPSASWRACASSISTSQAPAEGMSSLLFSAPCASSWDCCFA